MIQPIPRSPPSREKMSSFHGYCDSPFWVGFPTIPGKKMWKYLLTPGNALGGPLFLNFRVIRDSISWLWEYRGPHETAPLIWNQKKEIANADTWSAKKCIYKWKSVSYCHAFLQHSDTFVPLFQYFYAILLKQNITDRLRAADLFTFFKTAVSAADIAFEEEQFKSPRS